MSSEDLSARRANADPGSRGGWPLRLAVAVVVLSLIAVGLWLYRSQGEHLRTEAVEALASIDRLKRDDIAEWIEEHRQDAQAIARTPSLREDAAAWLGDGLPSAGERLGRELTALRDIYGYHDIFVVDPTGALRLSTRDNADGLCPSMRATLAEALSGTAPHISPLHKDGPLALPHMSVVVALHRGDGDAPFGALVIVWDPRSYLYPLVGSWPIPSDSAESALLLRDGDEVLVLSELRHQVGAALQLRLPLSATERVEVQAALGRMGFVEGLDYRGEPVLAVVDIIPGTPWFLLSKVDRSEAFALSRSLSALILALVLLVALVGAGLLTLLWQRDRKAHFHSLWAARERQAATLRSIGDGVIATDGQGRVELLNPVAEQLTGWREKDALGRPIQEVFDIVNEESRAAVENPVVRVLGEGIVVGLANHTLLIARDGTERPIADSGAPIQDPDGAITGAVLVFRDQSPERDAREQMRASLGERAALREQLAQSQKMEAIGALAGGVAHDFNNLLLVIGGCSEFLAESIPEGDPLAVDVAAIREATDRATELTHQLLAFSRRQIMDPRVLDPNEVMNGLEPMLRRILGEDIVLETHLEEDAGRVLIDPSQLEQVLMNLVTNARDAMAGGGRLTIETKGRSFGAQDAAHHDGVAPGDYVLIAVTDTGAGMDALTRARIFEPFFTTKGQGKGTGLGLSTVYGIVRQCHGSVVVYSEPGQGTTFKIYLPRADGDAVVSFAEDVVEDLGGDETILLVEDEDEVRKVTERILVARGYQVLSASDPEEAKRLAAHEAEIHLLLTDVVMPGESGRQLAERLTKERPGLRVLFMSGYTDNAIVHHGVLEPDTHFIGKPFSAVVLARKVREALD